MSTTISPETWNAAFDELADELLDEVGMSRPPIDAFELAERLKIVVAFNASQPVRGRHKKSAGQSLIFLQPDDRAERLHWAAAHELGEVVAHRVIRRVGFEQDETLPHLREQVANRMATAILLPTRWFLADARQFDGNLFELKRRYETASHELIGFRLLDLPEPTVISVFDQGQLTRRVANSTGQAPPLQSFEKQCWIETHRDNRIVERDEFGLTIQVWPIHEENWKREILRTTVTNEYDDIQVG